MFSFDIYLPALESRGRNQKSDLSKVSKDGQKGTAMPQSSPRFWTWLHYSKKVFECIHEWLLCCALYQSLNLAIPSQKVNGLVNNRYAWKSERTARHTRHRNIPREPRPHTHTRPRQPPTTIQFTHRRNHFPPQCPNTNFQLHQSALASRLPPPPQPTTHHPRQRTSPLSHAQPFRAIRILPRHQPKPASRCQRLRWCLRDHSLPRRVSRRLSYYEIGC